MRRNPVNSIPLTNKTIALGALAFVFVIAPAQGESSHMAVPKQEAVTAASKLAPKLKPEQHDQETADLLKKFYDRLAQVQDAESANILENAIEMMWHRSGSDTIDLLMTRSLTAVNDQDAELALKLLNSVTEMAPNFTEGWNRKAYVHFSQKRYAEALEDLRRALALDPRHFKAMDGLANVLREVGDKKRALQIYRTLLKVHPFWPGAKVAIEELTREVDGQEI